MYVYAATVGMSLDGMTYDCLGRMDGSSSVRYYCVGGRCALQNLHRHSVADLLLPSRSCQ